MERDDVLIAFKGSITSELLTSILQIMETKMEDLHEAPRTKKKVFNVLVECLQNLYHHIDDFEVHKLITSFGFSPISYDPFNRKISCLDSFLGQGNTIYIKDLDDAQNRVLASPSVCIHTANNLII